MLNKGFFYFFLFFDEWMLNKGIEVIRRFTLCVCVCQSIYDCMCCSTVSLLEALEPTLNLRINQTMSFL